MNQDTFSRRTLLLGAVALVAASPLRTLAQGTGPAIHVMKDPNCGCCSAWIDILENDGFVVTTEASAGTLLMRYKLDNGIPQEMVSCHTGRVDGYMIEGHVPAADIPPSFWWNAPTRSASLAVARCRYGIGPA